MVSESVVKNVPMYNRTRDKNKMKVHWGGSGKGEGEKVILYWG